MRIRPASALLLLSLAPWHAAAVLAAGESVNLQIGNVAVRAYLANIPDSRNSPGLVLLHDYWGLNEQITGVADRLSGLGYVVIAPDLYKGRLAADPGLAKEMMHALSEDRAASIVKGAIDFLKKLDRAPGRPVATIGFGMGGRISLVAALRGADVRGTVLYYGRVETAHDALAPIKAPVLAIFGGGDPGIPEKDVRAFESALKETGRDVTIISYPGVGHAFMDESRPDFEENFAKDAWIRMRDWLADKLQPTLPPKAPEGPRTAPGKLPPYPAQPAPTPPGR